MRGKEATDMEISQLSCFVTLANILNFRQTARQLGVSQSSVSREIGQLERSLGVTLFSRSSRQVSLTEEGAALLPYALDILSTAQSAELLVGHFREGAAGHLYISALTTCSSMLTRALDSFFSRHPDVIVDVAFQTAAGQTAAMHESRYDVHLLQQDMLPPGGGWDSMTTHKDSLALVVPKGHPLARRPLDFRALEHERFILSQEPCNTDLYRKIMAICAAHGFVPSIMNRYDKLDAVLLAVSAGLGVSIMPSALPSVLFANSVDVVPITDMDTSRSYIAAWRPDGHNPSVRLFLDVLRACVQPDGGTP